MWERRAISRLIDTITPNFWIATVVKNGIDPNMIFANYKNQCERKSIDLSSAHNRATGKREGKRSFNDTSETTTYTIQKLDF